MPFRHVRNTAGGTSPALAIAAVVAAAFPLVADQPLSATHPFSAALPPQLIFRGMGRTALETICSVAVAALPFVS